MLKNLTRGSLKVGFKMVVGLYVHLIMTVIYALATLVGGGNALKTVKMHKKSVRMGILGITGGCIGLKVFFKLKETYLLCERVGYTWLIEFITLELALNVVIIGSFIYFVINLIKAYSVRHEDNSNKLLVAIVELIGFIVVAITMVFMGASNKYFYLLGVYPVVKWVIKNRLSAVIETVVESTDEVVNVEDIRENLMRRMNKIAETIYSVESDSTDEVAEVNQNINPVVSNEVSWDDLGIIETNIEQQITSESLATTVETVKPVVLPKSDLSVVADSSVVSVTSTENEPKKEGSKKLNLKMIKNMGTQKAPERRVRTEQLNESMSDLLSDSE